MRTVPRTTASLGRTLGWDNFTAYASNNGDLFGPNTDVYKRQVVGYRHGEFMDFDINEALAMQKDVSPYMWEVCNSLSHNYSK